MEGFILHTIYHSAYHVGRKNIRGELYTAVLSVDQLGQSLYGQCLGKTGHTFEQHVAVGKKSHKKAFYQVFLSYDGLVHSSCDEGCKIAFARYQLVEFANVDAFAHSDVYIISNLYLSLSVTERYAEGIVHPLF